MDVKTHSCPWMDTQYFYTVALERPVSVWRNNTTFSPRQPSESGLFCAASCVRLLNTEAESLVMWSDRISETETNVFCPVLYLISFVVVGDMIQPVHSSCFGSWCSWMNSVSMLFDLCLYTMNRKAIYTQYLRFTRTGLTLIFKAMTCGWSILYCESSITGHV